MRDCPKTLTAARKVRYNAWGGNPKGIPYQEGKCAYQVWSTGRGASPYQCRKKNGHGPGGLYCKTHAMNAAPADTPTTTGWKVGVGIGRNEIVAVEIAKWTAQSVVLRDGRREAISNQWHHYCKTKEDAHAFVEDGLIRAVQSAEMQYREARVALNKFLADNKEA